MRRRRLSADDAALWAEVARTARPLHPDAAPLPPPPTPAAPPPPDPAPPAKPRRPAPHSHGAAVPATILGPATPGLDRRTAERLRRGRTEPQARIDLHGHTLDQAHGALAGFIRGSHSRGLRCVLVITGKGRPRQDDRGSPQGGILRESVPRWLALPPLAGLIVGVFAAHPRHGGGGAFYVYLRKPR